MKTVEENPGRIFVQIKAEGRQIFKIRRPYWAEGNRNLVNGERYETQLGRKDNLVFDEMWGGSTEIED